MSQRDIRSLFGKKAGGGDDEKTESAHVLKQNEKRKTQQKEYDKKRRKRDVKEAWLEEFSWAQKDDELNLYCKVCRKFPSLADTKSSLFTGISTNFKKETLKFHDKASESFKTYGDEEIDKLVQHFTPVLTEEEQENAVD